MPDLEPVGGDPFASSLVPVSGDPFSGMTHYADSPTGAQQVLHGGLPLASSTTNAAIPPGLTESMQRGLGDTLRSRGMPEFFAKFFDDIGHTIGGGVTPMPGEMGMAKPWGYWGNEGLPLIQRSLDAGKTQREIALEHGVDQSTISQIMKKYGLQAANSRGPRPKSDEDVHNLKEMIDKGMTWQAIADNLGVKSQGSVANLAKRYGLTGEQTFGVTPTKSVTTRLPEGTTQTLYGAPAASAAPKAASDPNIRLEPIEHDPFAEEDARIFGYREP